MLVLDLNGVICDGFHSALFGRLPANTRKRSSGKQKDMTGSLQIPPWRPARQRLVNLRNAYERPDILTVLLGGREELIGCGFQRFSLMAHKFQTLGESFVPSCEGFKSFVNVHDTNCSVSALHGSTSKMDWRFRSRRGLHITVCHHSFILITTASEERRVC